MSHAEYNAVLREVLRCVRDMKKGVVGAAVVDGEKRVVKPSDEVEGEFLHAERNALESFQDKYGSPSSDAVVVTTLSPCKIDDEHRVGASCTDMLCSESVSRVHTGFVDPWQLPVAEYESLGMCVTETEHEVLYDACEALFEYFPRTIEAGEEIDIEEFVTGVIPEDL